MPQKGKHRPPHRKEKKQHGVPATLAQQAQTQQAQMVPPVVSTGPVKVGGARIQLKHRLRFLRPDIRLSEPSLSSLV